MKNKIPQTLALGAIGAITLGTCYIGSLRFLSLDRDRSEPTGPTVTITSNYYEHPMVLTKIKSSDGNYFKILVTDRENKRKYVEGCGFETQRTLEVNSRGVEKGHSLEELTDAKFLTRVAKDLSEQLDMVIF